MPLKYIRGDLFSASSSNQKLTILAHACNPFGLWGAGVASQFKKRYPKAYTLYAEHCRSNKDLLGTCYLARVGDDQPLVACLFTSDFTNTPSQIVSFTEASISDLARQVESLKDIERDDEGRAIVNMPQINSGIFNVPWEDTEEALSLCDSLSFRVFVL